MIKDKERFDMNKPVENFLPIDYARAACDTLMRKFEKAPQLPPAALFL